MKSTNFVELKRILNKKIAMHAKTNMEDQPLHQLQGQLMEAISLLKDVVETLRELEPNAVSAIKAEVLKIFDDDE